MGLGRNQIVGRTCDPGEGVVQHLGVDATALFEMQTLGRAHEQRESEPLFERADMTADGTLGNTQLIGCPRETQMPGRGLEGAKRIEGK
jgi:hypothetical protein